MGVETAESFVNPTMSEKKIETSLNDSALITSFAFNFSAIGPVKGKFMALF